MHGPPMLVDKTNFGLVLYNHANFYRFEETSSHWSVRKISVFSLLFIRYLLHGPPMLVDKTNFGLVSYNHANFYRFEETSIYWPDKRISGFLCFSLVNQRHTFGSRRITVL